MSDIFIDTHFLQKLSKDKNQQEWARVYEYSFGNIKLFLFITISSLFTQRYSRSPLSHMTKTHNVAFVA